MTNPLFCITSNNIVMFDFQLDQNIFINPRIEKFHVFLKVHHIQKIN